jgi:uncharacterized membrane protein YeiB
MARIGIIFGLALCGLTIACLVQSTTKNPYLFIPMILGIPMLFLGVVALNPHRRRQAMNVAATISTMGLVVGGIRSLFMTFRWARNEPINAFALKMVLTMTAICLAFVLLWATSWARLRRHSQLDSAAGKLGPATAPKKQGLGR